MAKKKKLGTKDVKVGGGGIPKTLQPGNITCKINAISVEDFKFIEDALNIILDLESEPIADFEGFLIDKDDENGPRYAGQVGKVRASEYAYADGETKGGIEIFRDKEILKFLKSLCISLDCVKWFEDQDSKHDTVEELIDAFNTSGVLKDKWLYLCLGGKEYMNKNNYVNYDLFLPKYSKAGAPFASVDKKNRVVEYDEEKHIRRKKVEEVDEFGGDEPEIDNEDDDFSV